MGRLSRVKNSPLFDRRQQPFINYPSITNNF